ncbi:eclosion hormone [Neocloeon triangulifer]|uniref:eclosion hormone n=1 Tax=Neocloeon triangulifer TaxID=2078957 RepID=UPI00286EDE51|nr:eclosion hormone [Neocloeon triangulifer]XP_059477016.1 eclosion hormone [Neocloeon triangulifer]
MIRARALMVLVALLVCGVLVAEGNPLAVCIRNCAQCKKMFGDYFEGQMCADWCVKFKGKLIPDCEDIDTIAQFLNKLE